MKLTKDQIQQIEKHLDFKELTHLDLRNEVLDHMAMGIEKSLQRDGLSFKDAFNKEEKKWNVELNEYSTFWLGLGWVGPKLMMNKCVRTAKSSYLKTLLVTGLITAVLYLYTLKFAGTEFYEMISQIVGYSYLGIIIAMLYFYFRMKYSGYDTTFKYLFKIHAVGIGFMYVIYNPLWAFYFYDMVMENKLIIFNLFMHTLLIVFSFTYFSLYRVHFNAKGLNLV